MANSAKLAGLAPHQQSGWFSDANGGVRMAMMGQSGGAVPVDEANPQREVTDSDGDGIGREIGQVVGLLETATAMLRERGEEADVFGGPARDLGGGAGAGGSGNGNGAGGQEAGGGS